MRKNECDICGQSDQYLTELRDIYKTDGVVDLCEDCAKILNKRLDQIRSLLADVRVNWFKRFISQLKAKQCQGKQECIGR